MNIFNSNKRNEVNDILHHKAYKFRINPTKEQQILIMKTIGCSRFVYNHFLAKWNETYANSGKGLSYHACSTMLPKMKREAATYWLNEVDSIALQSSVRHLADSFSRFFNKQTNKPRFKSKSHPVQSYLTKNVNQSIALEDRHIKLPKLGRVKLAKSREPKGRILNATIRRNASGKFFVSILCEEHIGELPKTGATMGIDLGITDFAVLSNGDKKDNHRFTATMAQKLVREQRKLSRRALLAKTNGIPLSEAKNYQKQKNKVAKLHEKVINQRTDFLNKLSTDLIKNHDVICIEDLNTKGMLRNRKLAKSISDVSWSSFVAKLEYKAAWYGRDIVKVDRWFPSSQLCSACGHKAGKMALHIRAWTCSQCHTYHDRDINASKNILNEGLRILAHT